MPRLRSQKVFSSFFPSFSSLQGLHMRGYQHHRRPSRISWYSPCQHHRGAEWLAEFHTLVQASQRTLRACPRNASWPQPQSLALTGSKARERERGNTVITSEETEVSHTATLTRETHQCLSKDYLCSIMDGNDPSGTRIAFVASHHWKSQMSWNLLMSVATTAPAGSRLWGLVFFES